MAHLLFFLFLLTASSALAQINEIEALPSRPAPSPADIVGVVDPTTHRQYKSPISALGGGGGATFPTTTNLFKGNNAAGALAATPQVDYDLSLAQTVGDANGITGNTASAWPATANRLVQNVALTANRQTPLPLSISLPIGKVITFSDGVTTGTFGRGFIPSGSDTLDGLTAGAIGTPTPVFIKGALDANGNATTSVAQFVNYATGQWRRYNGGLVNGARDPVSGFSMKLNLSSLTSDTTLTMTDDGVVVIPSTATPGFVASGIDANGNVLYTSPLPDPTGHEGNILTVISGAATWSGGSGASPYIELDESTNPIVWHPIAGQRYQNAYIVLPANKSISIDTTSIQSGMEFSLFVIQDATGGRTLTALPAGSITPANGLGLITLTSAANAVDWFRFTYAGISRFNYGWQVAGLNLTGAAPVACNTAGVLGSTTGTSVTNIGSASNNIAVSNQFVATETSICRVDANLMRILSPNNTLHMAVFTDVPRSAGTVTDGVTTSGSPTVTSATAVWTNNDLGQLITGTGIPAGSYIGIVNSATSIGLSSSRTTNTAVNATATGTGITLSTYGSAGTMVGAGSTNNPSSSGLPNTLTGTGSADTTPTSFTGITATGLTVGTAYHMVCWTDGTADSANYVQWLVSAGSSTGIISKRSTSSANSGIWTTLNTKKARWQSYH